MNFSVALERFIRSGAEFTLVYNSAKKASCIPRMLILDSSFNPPHLAHFSLIKEALEYEFERNTSSVDTAKKQATNKSVLLLLSVKNADKIVPAPASFEHRLAMMQLMAHELEKCDVSVGIGLTTHAKFVDKSAVIQEYLRANSTRHSPSPRLTFLLGFDTLIRVLDPKYYVPASLSESLEKFMIKTDLFCLTRAEDDAQHEEQQTYVRRIASGEYPSIPRQWAKNIYVRTKKKDRKLTESISSSGIRNAYTASPVPVDLPLLKEIANYIKDKKLYQEANK